MTLLTNIVRAVQRTRETNIMFPSYPYPVNMGTDAEVEVQRHVIGDMFDIVILCNYDTRDELLLNNAYMNGREFNDDGMLIAGARVIFAPNIKEPFLLTLKVKER